MKQVILLCAVAAVFALVGCGGGDGDGGGAKPRVAVYTGNNDSQGAHALTCRYSFPGVPGFSDPTGSEDAGHGALTLSGYGEPYGWTQGTGASEISGTGVVVRDDLGRYVKLTETVTYSTGATHVIVFDLHYDDLGRVDSCVVTMDSTTVYEFTGICFDEQQVGYPTD